MGKLDGKVVIVTGASRGIGAEIARLFAAGGGKVVCAARTLHEGDHRILEGSLEKTVEQIRAAGGEAIPVAVDISDSEQCEKLVQAARDAYGPVDVLVNNAALTYYIPVKDYPISRWLRAWAVSFNAAFFLCKLVLEDMVPRRTGSIVNISSASAIGPGRGPYQTDPESVRGTACYGAEKAALERFSQGLAEEVYGYDISVTCVSPSAVVATEGAVFFNLVAGKDDPRAEPLDHMARAAFLLATEPKEKVAGRVTYSQQILKEYGMLADARGTGVDTAGSGYSQR